MGLRCLQTSIFLNTPSLEGLSTNAKEDPSPHEMRLSPAGHQPSISWSPHEMRVSLAGHQPIIIIIIIIIIVIIIIIIIIIIITIIIIIELTHSKTILENTAEIDPQPVALDLKNLSQYSSPSK